MARKFAVIGLSTFGYQLACELERLGGEVLVVDYNADVIQQIRDHVSHAVVCDALGRESLREIGLADVDVVIIGLRSRLDASILAAMYVQDLGVQEIVALAVSDDHRRALERLGVTRVIFPEKDMASRTASHLLAPNLIDYLWVVPGYGMVEVEAPDSFIGEALLELNIRQRYGVTVVAVRSQAGLHPTDRPPPEGPVPFVPTPDYVFQNGDVLIIFGKNETIRKFPGD